MSGGGSCPGATPITSRQGPSLPGSRCGRGTRAVCSLPPGETAHLPAALSTHSLSRALGQDGAGVCSLASRGNSPPPSRSVHSQSEPGPGAGRSRCVRPAVSAGVWTRGCTSRGIQGCHGKSSEAGLVLHHGCLRPGDKASLGTVTSRQSRSPVHCVHLFFRRCTFGQDPEAQLPACVCLALNPVSWHPSEGAA